MLNAINGLVFGFASNFSIAFWCLCKISIEYKMQLQKLKLSYKQIPFKKWINMKNINKMLVGIVVSKPESKSWSDKTSKTFLEHTSRGCLWHHRVMLLFRPINFIRPKNREDLIRKAEIRSGWGLVNEHGFYCIAKNGSSNRKNTNKREREEKLRIMNADIILRVAAHF